MDSWPVVIFDYQRHNKVAQNQGPVEIFSKAVLSFQEVIYY